MPSYWLITVAQSSAASIAARNSQAAAVEALDEGQHAAGL
jgi:hypothetical protein